MGYSPKAITDLYPLLEKAFSSAERSGVYANKAGYHNDRNTLRRQGKKDDYSIQLDVDQLGDGDAGSAFDVKLNRAQLRVVTERMMKASKAKDPRLVGKIREWFGSYDGDGVDGYSLYRDRLATSDDSHEWHLHISGYRKYVNDAKVWLGIAEVLLGLKAGVLSKPTYLPTYLVDPLKVSTTMIANAPAGKKNLERPPLFRVTTGIKIVTEGGHRWLVTEADYSYRLDFLVLESEFKARPVETAPVESQPATQPEPALPPAPAPEFELLIELDAPGHGNWQGAMRTATHWFMTEAKVQTDGSEDCLVHRFAAGGRYLDTMTLNADKGVKVHPTGWGVSDGDIVWMTWNDTLEGNDIVTLAYKAGGTIKKSACQEMTVFNDGNVQIAFDDSRELASLRHVTKTHDVHTLHRKQDILDNNENVLGVVKIPRQTKRVVQGFTVARGHLYVLVGLHSAGSPFAIEKWSFSNGQFVQSWPIPDGLGDEPEGIDASNDEGDLCLLFGMKAGKGDARRLRIFKHHL